MTAASGFASLGLSARISSTVAALGYDTPTPIQEQAIPAVLAGKDLIGLAQTGTGKTAAFALPIINKLSEVKKRGVRALIVAPTRELAQQIVEAIKKYSEGTGIKSTAIYGGVRMGSQLKRLRDGVDIVVGCPGRLVDHIQRRTLDLSQVETLVLDEADHMFDMGFLPDIKKLVSYVPKKRQTLLFSATMPKEIRGLAEDVLTNPQSIQVSKGEMAETVTHALFPVSADLKSQLLEKILKQFEVKSTIIFTRTKQRAKRLADTLQRNGYKVASLQGNLSQARRQEAIKGFRDGKFDVLVATDLAARGIDVQQVTHVINFDIPMTVEGYTHRIGRTGRAAREGEAFTLISREDEGKVRAIERVMGMNIERRRVDDFDYGSEAYNDKSTMSEGSSRSRSQRGPRRTGGSNFKPRERRDFGRGRDGARPERQERFARSDSRGSDDRKSSDRPAFRSRGPERSGSERSGSERPERRFNARPPRRDDRPDRSGSERGGAERPERRFNARPPRRDDRPARSGDRDQAPRREFSGAPTERRDRDSRPRSDRPFDRGSYAKKRGFGERESGPRPERRERSFSDAPRKSGPSAERSFTGDRTARPERPYKKTFSRERPGTGAGSSRPRGRFKSRPR